MIMARQYGGPPEGEDRNEAQIGAAVVVGCVVLFVVIMLLALLVGGGW